MLSVFEDAHACKRPLYAAYLDFADAFGSIPHARIAEVFQLLGLPADAIAAVSDIYTNATTALRLPAGVTEKIPFERGTLHACC